MRARTSRIVAAACSLVILGSLLSAGVTGAGVVQPSATSGAAPAAAPATMTCAPESGIPTCHLYAEDGGTAVLTGAISVPIWGYATTDGGDPTIPGPTIVATEGETVRIVIHNNLAEATSLALPGQRDVDPAVQSDLVGAAPGGMKTYEFEASAPGTFLYQAGPTANGARQAAMGLYGALVIRPAGEPLQAYGDAATAFDSEQVLVISEVDPDLNDDPTGFDMADYHPVYWLFNGKAYPDTERIEIPVGDTLLIRYVNAGLENQSVGLLSRHQQVVGVDGEPLAHPVSVSAETLPAGGTLDALVAASGPPTENADVVWSAAGHLDNAGAPTPIAGPVDFGGMLAFVDIVPGDTVGPEVLFLGAAPNPTIGLTTVGAVASDLATGGLPIAAAEYSIDSLADAGLGTLMLALDGLFDEPAEAITATVDLSSYAPGDHTVYVRARDLAGNWGAAASTTVTLAILFADSFETASTDQWDTTITTAGNVSVTSDSQLVGERGLRVVINGNTPGYVVDRSPASEASYHARFYFDPNGTLGNGHTIFDGRDGAGSAVFRIETRRQSSGARQLRASVRTSGGMVNSAWITMTDDAHAIEIAWLASTTGALSLRIDGVVRATLTGDTGAYRLDEVRLGPSHGLNRGTRGTEFFDGFVSSRTLDIGP